MAHSAISIHALREEGDTPESGGSTVQAAISIHALREEGDFFRKVVFSRKNRFLSTPSARRATQAECLDGRNRNISIHALREEGDR